MGKREGARKDREIVCYVCKKKIKSGSGLTSMMEDYSHCAECLEKEGEQDEKDI